jgi:hypothetical protein
MVLPCAHRITERLAGTGYLTLEDIYSHWHLSPCPPLDPPPLVLESAIAQVRGWPSTQPERSPSHPNRAARSHIAASSS